MGDMLVKSGDWQTGIKIYENAKLVGDYKSWPFRDVLNERISNAESNVENFREENSGISIMAESGYNCMACHQAW